LDVGTCGCVVDQERYGPFAQIFCEGEAFFRLWFVRRNAASGSVARNTISPERKTNEASAADEWDFALQVKVKIECIINELLKTCKLLKISKIR